MVSLEPFKNNVWLKDLLQIHCEMRRELCSKKGRITRKRLDQEKEEEENKKRRTKNETKARGKRTRQKVGRENEKA